LTIAVADGVGCAAVIVDSLELDREEFARGTGWALEPEGACKGDMCVPLGDAESLEAVAERLGMAFVRDVAQGLAALGPASVGGRALTSAQAPELELPDLDGRPFKLSSLRGQKVVLVAWAPY
jgi:hypothetical protein